jgi:hypothetical protein
MGITQKSAWHMPHRMPHALHVGWFEKLSGEVESDEIFVGEKSKNMHLGCREEAIKEMWVADNTIIHGVLERGGEVRASVIERPLLHADIVARIWWREILSLLR